MVGADDQDVCGAVVEAGGEVVDVVGVDQGGAVGGADFFAADLAAVGVEGFEVFADGAGETADFADAGAEFDAGGGVGGVEDGFGGAFAEADEFGGFFGEFLFEEAVEEDYAGFAGGVEGEVFFAGFGEGRQPFGVVVVFVGGEEVCGAGEFGAEFFGERGVATVADLNDVGVGGIDFAVEGLVDEVGFEGFAVDDDGYFGSFAVRQGDAEVGEEGGGVADGDGEAFGEEGLVDVFVEDEHMRVVGWWWWAVGWGGEGDYSRVA